ncbi:unnamed protein product [Sphagnum troendelagicum]
MQKKMVTAVHKRRSVTTEQDPAAEPPRIVRSLEWPTTPTPPCTEFFTPLSHEAFKMHAVIQVLEETPIGSFSALFLQEWI